ncbi:MAG: flagellar basal body-associated FliL family protein [Bacillaceae bacterium]|nr:flagellar basal body-associated FliL family protein [Bacillaceae bacterium]
MFQNKLFNMAIIILVAIALLGTVTFVLWKTYLDTGSVVEGSSIEEEPKSIDEILSLTISTDEITTNLYSGDFIMVQFDLQVDNEEARAELEKRLNQVNHIVIKILSSSTPEDINGAEGLTELEARIMNEVNAILNNGRVVKVYTTKKVLQ